MALGLLQPATQHSHKESSWQTEDEAATADLHDPLRCRSPNREHAPMAGQQIASRYVYPQAVPMGNVKHPKHSSKGRRCQLVEPSHQPKAALLLPLLICQSHLLTCSLRHSAHRTRYLRPSHRSRKHRQRI